MKKIIKKHEQILLVLSAIPPLYEKEKFLSRPCESGVFLCDHCDVQYRCYDVFKNGDTCPIINEKHVWMRYDFKKIIKI